MQYSICDISEFFQFIINITDYQESSQIKMKVAEVILSDVGIIHSPMRKSNSTRSKNQCEIFIDHLKRKYKKRGEIMNIILKPYIQIVDFLGKVLGKNFEIILHDLENLDGSVVASANSTRKIGDSFWGPISKISDRIYNNQLNFEQDYIINYDGLSKTGDPVKFSTFFIKDEDNKTIGLLGINADYSDLEIIKEKVDSLLNFDMMGKSENKDLDSIEIIASNIIDNTVNEFRKKDPEMSLDRKLKLVEEFNKKGVFLVKGTVQKIAKLLDISEPSIYRYLSKIKDTSE